MAKTPVRLERSTGGGAYDPTDRQIYFIASNPETLIDARPVNNHMLVAINELDGAGEYRDFEALFAPGFPSGDVLILIDSGIFELAMRHAKIHGLPLDQVLSLAPEEVDGYQVLEEKYLRVVQEREKQLWGYVELDIGGPANKTRTRRRLETLGLAPIPVYHPVNDGWDYFDVLARKYDRIAVGNVVHADGPTRVRLFQSVYERARRYPGLWIHWLGVTPMPWLIAAPSGSCDSSTWLNPLRWPTNDDKCALASMGQLPPSLIHVTGHGKRHPAGASKARLLHGYRAALMEHTWRAMVHGIRDYATNMDAIEIPIRRGRPGANDQAFARRTPKKKPQPGVKKK
jgi:hypothetical protein